MDDASEGLQTESPDCTVAAEPGDTAIAAEHGHTAIAAEHGDAAVTAKSGGKNRRVETRKSAMPPARAGGIATI